ncbi:MAG: hypothetical protein CM1200mP41_36710 [Gammaproteobacteria bacterium]|nr:MAG: hypothetical protein CM1200mP41_36710 [Gammaproteobacteria bacterium]
MMTFDRYSAKPTRRPCTGKLAAEPVLMDVVTAADAIPELGEGMILHAGPPISWERMCGPMRGAVAGIAVFEGWANDLEAAAALAGGARFSFPQP